MSTMRNIMLRAMQNAKMESDSNLFRLPAHNTNKVSAKAVSADNPIAPHQILMPDKTNRQGALLAVVRQLGVGQQAQNGVLERVCLGLGGGERLDSGGDGGQDALRRAAETRDPFEHRI